MKKINIETLFVGSLETCCYLVWREGAEECVCIDPGGDAQEIVSRMRTLGLLPGAVLVTHSHFDHVGGVAGIKEEYPTCPVIAHETCSERMQAPEDNLGFMMGLNVRPPSADRVLIDGEKINLCDLEFTALFVPGHAPGHMAFYLPEAEALFLRGCVICGVTRPD